jgi:hypothetical protein
MTSTRRTFTAADLATGVRVVLANVARCPKIEGVLEIIDGTVYLHTLSGHVEELPSDLNAIAARVVEIVSAKAVA